jgi:thiol-disulfide isomerase/thioredoxin
MAFAIAFNWTGFLKNVPGYTNALQNHFEKGGSVTRELRGLEGEHANRFATAQAASPAASLANLGHAPNFTGITQWLNTPGDKPLSLAKLRGKVVLVDFWTYSCINCQRSLPHVEAWYREYHRYGLEVIGVHTPEFPFEYVVSNVRAAAARLGVDYPVAVDDKYATWDAYNNNSWPAEYLIDQNGNVRHTSFGEGDYATTERDIRLLLMAGGAKSLPKPTDVADRTPQVPLTTETYLGSERFDVTRYVGTAVASGGATHHYAQVKTVSPDQFTLSGTWSQQQWSVTAGPGAGLELGFTADDVYLVLGGTGTVSVSVDGHHVRTVAVSGLPDLYTLATFPKFTSGELSLSVSPGVMAYDFTFG